MFNDVWGYDKVLLFFNRRELILLRKFRKFMFDDRYLQDICYVIIVADVNITLIDKMENLL
jgi:hypothetical protein